MRTKRGKIIPNGVSLEKHENDIVVVFTELGFDVELIPRARSRQRKTADAIIGGLEWEFKSPRGNSTRTIQHIFKKAAKQSENIVIDLARMTIPDAAALRKIRHEVRFYDPIKRLKVITKARKILDIK